VRARDGEGGWIVVDNSFVRSGDRNLIYVLSKVGDNLWRREED